MKRNHWGVLLLFGASLSLSAKSAERNGSVEPLGLERDHRRTLVENARQGQDNGTSAVQDRGDARREDQPNAREEHERVTLPANTTISVRIADEINSSKNHTGDLFTGIVDPSVMIHDRVVIPRGTEAHVRMAEDKKGGHLHGKARVNLELVSLVVNGRRLGMETDVEGKEQGALGARAKAEEKSAEHMGSATGPAGPAGAAAGPVVAVFSAAKVEMKPNSRIEFTLAQPFTFEKPPITGAEQAQQ